MKEQKKKKRCFSHIRCSPLWLLHDCWDTHKMQVLLCVPLPTTKLQKMTNNDEWCPRELDHPWYMATLLWSALLGWVQAHLGLCSSCLGLMLCFFWSCILDGFFKSQSHILKEWGGLDGSSGGTEYAVLVLRVHSATHLPFLIKRVNKMLHLWGKVPLFLPPKSLPPAMS